MRVYSCAHACCSADGPVIQKAHQHAVSNHVDLEQCLEFAKQARSKGATVPLVLMTYYNPVYQYGLKRFVERCEECGVDGLIPVDLPPEHAMEDPVALGALCQDAHLSIVYLVAPTTPRHRLEFLRTSKVPFVYTISVTGVTGQLAAGGFDDRVTALVSRVREYTDAPVVLGFGISK
eukprot:GHVU01167896.1.p2 GENE.GHVU01167896.1~~GHVU01167896.1.p2  ORF type:complete len:177 (+),score=27.47 GHVU01167896.1:586-1116(+)